MHRDQFAPRSHRGFPRAAIAMLLLTGLAGACQRAAVATPAPTTHPGADALLTLAVGQAAEIASATTLRLDRIVSDSRCPADVQCIWAGEVRIALSLASPAGRTRFELSALEHSARVQAFAIELVSFGACPGGHAGTTATAATTAECAVLRVSPASH